MILRRFLSMSTIDLTISRCPWSIGKTDDEEYIKYHDEEWGVPVFDDLLLFEFLVLESNQAGLSWRTILRKRENYREAFSGFDWREIAKYDEAKVEQLMQNKGIIRNRAKIKATINNAEMFERLREEFGTASHYFWQWFAFQPQQPNRAQQSEIPAVSDVAKEISADMKKRGFKFFGPTICYAHLQATGMVNDHLTSCFRFPDITLLAEQVPSKLEDSRIKRTILK